MFLLIRGDGCCQCAISWEEYTPLIAACMEKPPGRHQELKEQKHQGKGEPSGAPTACLINPARHDEICDLLLQHAATQLCLAKVAYRSGSRLSLVA